MQESEKDRAEKSQKAATLLKKHQSDERYRRWRKTILQ